MLPKEHGAYGQIAFPIVTAFLVAGVSTSGLLMATAVIAGFLAHEPAAILLGMRGTRAKREWWSRAIRWLGCTLVVGVAAGAGALFLVDTPARWSILVPLAPTLLLAISTARGRDKSWEGEVAHRSRSLVRRCQSRRPHLRRLRLARMWPFHSGCCSWQAHWRFASWS